MNTVSEWSPFKPLRAGGEAGAFCIEIVDQTLLPFEVVWHALRTLSDVEIAIRHMQVRGAPLIGVTAAYGMALALRGDGSDATLLDAARRLAATRPTAVNLAWAISRLLQCLAPLDPDERFAAAWAEANRIADEDIANNRALGTHGLDLLRKLDVGLSVRRPLNLLTHCNAGALATAGWGTALSPIYLAQAAGLDVHVWVSETRPRNQGLLTAWELAQAGVAHTFVADNAAAWLMAEGRVDAIIVGADRVAANGDTANKIGTCLKACAAQVYQVPFYVAAPVSTIDRACPGGQAIPIEERSGDEIRFVAGHLKEDGKTGEMTGRAAQVAILPVDAQRLNPAFDVTPARFVTAFITEHGVFAPDELSGIRLAG